MHPVLKTVLTETAKAVGAAIVYKIVERADKQLFKEKKEEVKREPSKKSEKEKGKKS